MRCLNEQGLSKLLDYLESRVPGISGALKIDGNKLVVDNEISLYAIVEAIPVVPVPGQQLISPDAVIKNREIMQKLQQTQTTPKAADMPLRQIVKQALKDVGELKKEREKEEKEAEERKQKEHKMLSRPVGGKIPMGVIPKTSKDITQTLKELVGKIKSDTAAQITQNMVDKFP